MGIDTDTRWECLDCGHVWYDDMIYIFTECRDCESDNIESD